MPTPDWNSASPSGRSNFRAPTPRFLVTDACADLRQAAGERGLTFTIDADSDLPPLKGDPALVRLVVRNLVDNAIRYTAQGTVAVRLETVDGRHSVAVADTGPGIAPAFHERMFEPFDHLETSTTSAPRKSGSGSPLSGNLCRHWMHRIPV